MHKAPYLGEIPQTRDLITSFYGLNHTYGCKDYNFSDMQNMSSHKFPIFSTRDRITYLPYGVSSIDAIAIGNNLVVLEENRLLYVNGGVRYAFPSEIDRKLYKFGKYLLVMPDKVMIDPDTIMYSDDTIINIEATTESIDGCSIFYADSNGNKIYPHPSSYYDANKPSDKDYLVSEKDGKTTLQQYSSATSSWNYVSSPKISIESTEIMMYSGKYAFKEGDGVTIEITMPSIDTWPDVKDVFPNEITKTGDTNVTFSTDVTIKNMTGRSSFSIYGIIKAAKTLKKSEATLRIKRKMPDLKYMIEYNNRLWGVADHEIRASKLGDITNWNTYEGLSTDSYAATIGTVGEITGSCVLGSNPIFFKEDAIIKVTVSGSGAHSYKEYSCVGIDYGSGDSVAIIDNSVYYCAPDGIYEYSGAIPTKISSDIDISLKNAVGGAFENKYYICGNTTYNPTIYITYCYDTVNKIWTKREQTEYTRFLIYRNLEYDFFFGISGNCLCELTGKRTWDYFGMGRIRYEDPFEWNFTSGLLQYENPDKKYISKINIKMKLDVGSYASVYIRYDEKSSYEHLYDIEGTTGIKTYTIPIKPIRCECFRYMVKGKGNAEILAISKTLEEGSDNF